MKTEDLKKIQKQLELMKQGGPTAVLLDALLGHFQSIKSIELKGDKGETPVKGRDYYTPADKQQLVVEVMSLLRVPQDGRSPAAGRDYPTFEQVREMVRGLPVPVPQNGYTPLRGVDYFTPEDIRHIASLLEPRLQEYAAQLLKDARDTMPPAVMRMPVIEIGGRGASRLLFRNGNEVYQDIQTIDFISGFTVARRAPGYLGLTAAGGSSGGSGPSFYDNETPGGSIDGVNVTFTLAHEPDPAASLQLYLNGSLLTQGVDYTLSGSTITFITAPDITLSGTPFKAFYRTSDGALFFADNETPGGSIDGANTSFSLAHSPSSTDSLRLSMNGSLLTQGVDYTLSGSTITFITAPDAALSGLPFKAFYRY